jgi:hypothetical protein
VVCGGDTLTDEQQQTDRWTATNWQMNSNKLTDEQQQTDRWTTTNWQMKRLRWARGSVLAFRTQGCGFEAGRSRRIFQGVKILSTPSFGGEVKPCKRSLNATWKSGISGKIYRPFLSPT